MTNKTTPTIVELDPDHPGFRDAAYRARRDAIAGLALAHRPGAPAPFVEYTTAEHRVWRTIGARLGSLGQEFGCRRVQAQGGDLDLHGARIPQLEALNRRLSNRTGFRFEPVAGLVSARGFLARLSRRRFLSTQYMRHASRPFYTPEPDVVHELFGHAASLADPAIADLNERIGRASLDSSARELQRLERVYWWVLEFGLVDGPAGPRAFGAGLLSSVEELASIRTEPVHLDWNLDRAARTPYDPTARQPQLFVAPTSDRLIADTRRWLDRGAWRDRGVVD